MSERRNRGSKRDDNEDGALARPDQRAIATAAANKLGEVLEFMRVIWQLDHALQKTSKRMERRMGVTGAQRLVVRIVGRFPEIPAGQLALLMHLHPSTLTGILRRLEEQGLLSRRHDPDDARRSLLRLTQKGRSFDVQAKGTVEASVAHVLKRKPARQLAAARSLLVEIAQQLTASSDAPASPRAIRRKPARR